MTSELMLIGMKYQAIFNQWLGSFLVEYDYTVCQYSFKNNLSQLKRYCFNNLLSLAAGGMVFGSIIIHLFICPLEGFTALLIPIYIIVLLAIIFLVVLIPFSLIVKGKEPVMSVNALIFLLKYFRSMEPRKKPKRYKSGLEGFIQKAKDLTKNESNRFDVMGATIFFIASYSLWLPPFFTAFTVAANMDPLMILMTAALGSKTMSSWGPYLVTLVVSLINLIIVVGFAVRVFQVIVVLYIITLQFYLKIQEIIQKMFEKSRNKGDFERLHVE
jgi:hypothetical protein